MIPPLEQLKRDIRIESGLTSKLFIRDRLIAEVIHPISIESDRNFLIKYINELIHGVPAPLTKKDQLMCQFFGYIKESIIDRGFKPDGTTAFYSDAKDGFAIKMEFQFHGVLVEFVEDLPDDINTLSDNIYRESVVENLCQHIQKFM